MNEENLSLVKNNFRKSFEFVFMFLFSYQMVKNNCFVLKRSKYFFGLYNLQVYIEKSLNLIKIKLTILYSLINAYLRNCRLYVFN